MATGTKSVKLTADQELAFQEACDFLDSVDYDEITVDNPYVFKIGGYAGTGKTTLSKRLVDAYPNGAVCAFTGKATSLLRQKDLQASTIHSLIYTFDTETEEFFLKPELGADYILIDEASMVSMLLWKDLIKFCIPIIAVGDPGQLEPIGDDPRLMNKPDIVLEQIHRQAAGSPIIKLAAHVRKTGKFLNQKDQKVAVLGDRNLFWSSLNWADQLLCGYNTTRVSANTKYRSQKKYKGLLCEGEKIICLSNNRHLGVYNGMMFTVNKILSETKTAKRCLLHDGYQSMERWVTTDFLNQEKPDSSLFRDYRDHVVVDYGYCTTVHKFQGSEADKVCVLDEQASLWDTIRWRYTAITRASKELRYAR